MVAHSRTAVGAHALRSLGLPEPLAVRCDAGGTPQAVRRPGWQRPRRVEVVHDSWRIDDEWWRERPISRCYYALLLETGQMMTVDHDLLTEQWYEQTG